MDFATQLKSSVDIVGVIGEYVRLKKVGTRFSGLCPFHTEKTPSFSVNPAHQFFKCFGCGAGGDVLEFVMRIERLSFYETLTLLAERHGIPMPKRSEYSDQDSRSRKFLYEMHEAAAEFFKRELHSASGVEARSYLETRDVSPAMVEQFGLGYAPRSGRALRQLFERKKFPQELFEDSGLVVKRTDGSEFFDRFRNRLMFPIHNEAGRVIAFGGRALSADEPAKYLNSPETKIYRKGTILYNLHRAKEAIRASDRVVLVEGYMDVIGVFEAGVKEVVASCGTALTSQQVQSLRRQSQNIAVNFDPDQAGANAAERSIQMLLEESMHVRIVALSDGLDPDEYCKKFGAEAYSRQVASAKGYFFWLADRARSKFDIRSAEGRMQGLRFLLPAIRSLGDQMERVAVANEVASYLGVDAGLILDNFRKMASDRSAARTTAAAPALDSVHRILLSSLLSSEEARNLLLPELRLLEVWQASSASAIYRTILALEQESQPICYSEVHARLEERGQELLSSLLSENVEPSLDDAAACLHALQRKEAGLHGSRHSELKARVRAAEREGKMDEAMRLALELSAYEKRAVREKERRDTQ